MKYSKLKPQGYFQKWQLKILKNAWENNASYLIHEMGVSFLEVNDWDNTYAPEEMLDMWNELYQRYSAMLPQFKDKAMNNLLREAKKHNEKTKVEKEPIVKEEPINIPLFLLKKKTINTDLG